MKGLSRSPTMGKSVEKATATVITLSYIVGFFVLFLFVFGKITF